ncbi:formate dehydrogenase accessory sulfurtransferase FdhD [Marinomonas ostreistagni]|uniref:Formate dehydrogenase accessory sulfurtransferase FdhD n=1 Tax=Marinomonas ostreistagni TaxID=359209 RepID=A0ABS0Z8R4_9GAMM|nr:formate dehydrogenase accessory sulfurtransferase FdhD [Marinomonas ostreistagni]MBJ7550014.1 formate dehydrogenase accessory sulfurtransferase FdhD [Marinomonas ostreistagni]
MSTQGTSSINFSDQQGSSEIELVREVPIAISINDLNYAVIMVTDIDIEAFVVGFAFSEGLINTASEVLEIQLDQKSATEHLPEHLIANLALTNRAQQRSRDIMRRRKGNSGCGLCGIEAIEQAFPPLNKLIEHPSLSDQYWIAAKEAFVSHQEIGSVSGAIHGAMLLDKSGDFCYFAEDIGRHNALDKLIGKAMMEGHTLEGNHILMSSRCSTELILKAVRAKVSSLGHLASPSTLAVHQAKHYGLQLIHIPRKASPRRFTF